MVQDGRNDFDFIVGSWKVHHRRLRERLKGSTEWEEFEGTSVARPLLGGFGFVDENVMQRESGPAEGVSIRLFDPQSCQWTIYWTNGTSGYLQYPMVGRFENGRGEFYAQEPWDGRMIFTRFVWSNITETSAKWEQAFSTDGGKSWEINWYMTLIRQES